LNICKTQISDEGIKHLLGLKKIREIQAFPTNITAASAAPLAEALPCCYITTPFGAYHAQDGGWAWQMFHEPAKASKE
jgi:hypothetical protein